MAITSATRTDLIELAVIANNSSPGTTLLAELIAHVEAGKTLVEIGDALAARSSFKAVYPAIQTADEFAKEYVGNLLPEASADLKAECEKIVAAHVNAGKGLGELFVAIHGVFDTDTSDALKTHVSNFKNKASVAEYHTVTLETAAESTAVLASVDSNPLSVTVGKAGADNIKATGSTAPAPVAPVATYTLTANAAAVNEGESAVFTLDTANVASGSELSYSVSGVNGSDISGSTVGTTKVGADGKALIGVTTVADTTTEGAETLTVSVAGQSASVTVNDTSLTAPPAAQSFALTTGIDNMSGGGGGDTFSGTNATLTTGDILNGGEGSDTLSIAASLAGAAAVSGFSTTSIENISVNLIDGNAAAAHALTVNMVDTAAGTVTLSGTSATTQNDNLVMNNVDSGTQLTLQGTTNIAATVNYDAAYLAGTGDTATLTLSGVTATVAADSDITYGAGIEALTINSIGSSTNKIGQAVWGGATLNISGSANLNLQDALPTTVQTVDATGYTGKLTVSVGNSDDKTNVGGVDIIDQTIVGGDGDDTITTAGDAAVEMSVSGGAGNDTITIQALPTVANALGTLVADVIDGGDGTDTLAMDNTLAVTFNLAQSVNKATTSNFETLSVSDAIAGVVTPAFIQDGLSDVSLGTGSNGGTIAYPAGANTLKMAGISVGALTATDTGTATTDSLSITHTDATASADVFAGQNIVIAGLETLNIDVTALGTATQDFGAITMTADTGGTDTVNFSGGEAVTVGAITAEVINASGLAAAATGTTFSMGSAAVGVTTITGSPGADTLLGDTKTTINGGAGNDNITGGSGNDTLNGDAGNDTITTAAGNDVVDGGAGNDSFVFAGNLTTLDKVAGGDGTDTLSVTNASITAMQGQTISEANTFNTTFTGMETLLLTDTLDSTGDNFDLGYLGNINNVTLADVNGAQVVAGFNSGGTLKLTVTPSADVTATVNGAATGTTDAFNLNLTANAADDFDTVVIANTETINVSVNNVTAQTGAQAMTVGLTTAQATGGAAQTLNVTGAEAIIVDTAVTVGTINASGMAARTATTAGFSLTGAAHTAAQTFTGSSGIDVWKAGTKADTIDMGAGNDTVTMNTGADTIAGGTGTDTLISNTTQVAANIEGAGTGTSAGLVINATTAAITAATVLANTTTAGTAGHLGGGLTSVPAGTVAYNFGGSLSTNSSVTSTISGFETYTLSGNGVNAIYTGDGTQTVTGGSGKDFISTGAGNDIVSATAGTDVIDLGFGNDTFVLAEVAAIETVNAGTTVGLTSGGTADALAVVGGVTVANTVDFGSYTNFEKFIASAATTDVISLSLKADADSDMTGVRTIDFSADTNATGSNVIDASLVDGAYTITGSAGVDTITSSIGADLITGGGGIDVFTFTAANMGVAGYGATTSVSTASLDIVNFVKTENDTVDLTSVLATEANYDAFTAVTNGGNIVGTTVAGTDANGTVSLVVGIYDSAANTFTSTDQTLGTSNAVLIGAAAANAGTTATDSIVLVGLTGLTNADFAITNGVITV